MLSIALLGNPTVLLDGAPVRGFVSGKAAARMASSIMSPACKALPSEIARMGCLSPAGLFCASPQSLRTVFLSADARMAVADYLDRERARDAGDIATVLFLSAVGLPARAADGRLSPRAINLILEQIGRWHDAEQRDPARRIVPLRPHDLRHTFAFQLACTTGADAYELERRLGHRSQRYIQRYTNPPEPVAASYIEGF
jgi:hypothetical protein